MREVDIIPIPDTQKVLIYRRRGGLAFVGNRALANLALRLAENAFLPDGAPPEAAAFLRAVGFFDPLPPPPTAELAVFQPTTAVLLLTNQCQLRCTYCYAAAGEAAPLTLSFELGAAAIDYVCRQAQDMGHGTFSVSFHGGGEPTAAWTTLRRCAEYARQKPLRAHISLTSNGVWSPAQIRWILANLNSVSLSMDGSPPTQDRQRPLVSGRASSPFVLRTIRELDAHSFPYGIRMTATAPWDSVPDDVRFICEQTGCKSVQVEPAFNTKRGGHNQPDENEARAFAGAFLEAADIADAAGVRLYYSGARPGGLSVTFCSAPYQALIVNGGGQLVTCYEVASDAHTLARLSVIGQIENGVVKLDAAARRRLHALMKQRRQTCEDCFCYWSCAGDCYTRAFGGGPDGHLVHSRRCDMNRAITRDLLLRQIARNGGVWRASFRAAPGLEEH
ncbi:MAG: radical SAM protein [Chloroflexi bacterium]|nr:radical SAM protein [Chloroflexota bacterium]MDL1884516.1 radical SAM protein [Anaerolineae bacterium CFX8]